ncbi:MAG: 2-oxo acid dehydrogenase subunit E2 [Actinomycetota bacterium]|nr:2-oxo acid dehydrogenase subunit E2 [Actinomycetota bacterium]
MAVEFQMPKLGLTMEEGTIIEWLVADDAEVAEGTAVVRIETDKVETEVESSGGGRLHHVGQPGQAYACGAVIAVLLAPGEDPPQSSAPATATAPVAAAPRAQAATAPPVAQVRSADGRLLASPNARRVAAEAGIDIGSVAGTGPGGRIVSEDVEAAISAGTSVSRHPGVAANTRSEVVASVAARNLADLLGIDLAAVAYDPVEHRVTREGVAAYVRGRLAGPAAAAPTAAPSTDLLPASQTPTRTIRMAGMRGTIAKRMHASLREMAQLTLTMDADMNAVVTDRSRRKLEGVTVGFTDYVVAAAARALLQHPNVNAQITADGIAVLPDIHVGLAVALDDGLMVPVVRHADRLDLAALSSETTRLAQAARAGSLTLDELEGGTFSVTALGMFGVDTFTPVINPPNAAILGVGRLRDDVIVVDGAAGTTKRLTLSLTWDHRVLDGAPAAAFCQTIVDLLTDPSTLD